MIVFFRRERHALSRWNTLVAPFLALMGLVAAIVVIALYFPLLVGATDANGDATHGPTSFVLLGLEVVAPVAGLIQTAVIGARARRHGNGDGEGSG